MDIQLQKDYQKEIHAPFTDSLTGLYTHGFFQVSLDRELQRSRRYGLSFTIGLIDIDFLVVPGGVFATRQPVHLGREAIHDGVDDDHRGHAERDADDRSQRDPARAQITPTKQ